MQIINADSSRLIDLPGVGLCPRPVDIDQSVTGFQRLKSLRIYQFAADSKIEGDSEEDEVFVFPLGGAVVMEVTGKHPIATRLAEDGACVLYMAPRHNYELKPEVKMQVAYARAAATGRLACYVSDVKRGQGAEVLAYKIIELADGAQLDNDTHQERLIHVVSGTLVAGIEVVSASQTLALATNETMRINAQGATKLLVVHA